MTLKEIEISIYKARMTIRSIESAMTRVDPFSRQFENYMDSVLNEKRNLELLQEKRLLCMKSEYLERP